jgi:hypothetical protein
VEAEEAKGGRKLLMKKVLLKPEKEGRITSSMNEFVQDCLQNKGHSLQDDYRQWEN